jgi:spore maturation protein CgeB
MRVVLFCHSLISCWNHGNAHFLRGVVKALQALGHSVTAFEPADGWSRQRLMEDHGETALDDFRSSFPSLTSHLYRREQLDLDQALDGADLVIVHEWNDPVLVETLGRHRVGGGSYLLLFHDTHHRALTRADEIAAFDLEGYDGVLAFGETVRELYQRHGWGRQVWTWHEAADLDLFRPHPEIEPERDLIWVGNWGDGERTEELETFLLQPIEQLELSARIHGVRYPETALARLRNAGIDYGGPRRSPPRSADRCARPTRLPRRCPSCSAFETTCPPGAGRPSDPPCRPHRNLPALGRPPRPPIPRRPLCRSNCAR